MRWRRPRRSPARSRAGPRAYAEVPWFWSDQYDLKLQIAGVSGPDAEYLLRGDPASRAFSCLHLRGGRLIAIDAINRGADFLGGQGADPGSRADRPGARGRSRRQAQ